MESVPPRTQYSTLLPPPRGRVKAQIFQGLAGNLSKALAKMKRGGSSPPESVYASDGFADHA